MGYFCTRNNAYVHYQTDRPNELKLKIYFQKRFQKACEIRKWKLLLRPAKRVTFLERLLRKLEENEIKFSKKNFKKFLPVRNRSCSFAPASRNTIPTLRDELNKTKKQEDTFLDILNWQPFRSNTKQKNKSNRIERFEKTTRPSVK